VIVADHSRLHEWHDRCNRHAHPTARATRNRFWFEELVGALRAEIRKVQKSCNGWSSCKRGSGWIQFDNIAGFSAEVTPGGLKALQAHPSVISIEPVIVISTHLAQGIPLMHGMTYRSAYNGAGMSIAICDTGVDYNHPRLGGGGFPNSKVLGGFDLEITTRTPFQTETDMGRRAQV